MRVYFASLSIRLLLNITEGKALKSPTFEAGLESLPLQALGRQEFQCVFCCCRHLNLRHSCLDLPFRQAVIKDAHHPVDDVSLSRSHLTLQPLQVIEAVVAFADDRFGVVELDVRRHSQNSSASASSNRQLTNRWKNG